MTTPAIAPFAATYTSHAPYLTLDEWLAAPTSIDINDLITGGTPDQQKQVVANQIERASSWIDDICQQVLAASVDTHRGRYLVNQWGTVKVPLPNKPILEVSAVSVGSRPSSMVALTSLADIDISDHGVIEVPIVNVARTGATGGVGVASRPLVAVTYVFGYPNTTLTGAVAAATSSITLASALGIYPGTGLTIYDVTTGNESVTVASTYIPGSTTVALTGPTGFAHATGVSVSNLPARVKEAAILLTTELIQTRGNDAIVLDSMTAAVAMSAERKGSAANIGLAMGMLKSLRRVR